MKLRWFLIGASVLVVLVVVSKNKNIASYDALREATVKKFGARLPSSWGETVNGVKTRLDTTRPSLALTLDACGSKGDGFDAELIDYLMKEKIPATLFINGRWIDKNPETFKTLSENRLFEIENHGLEHRPCSVNGKSVYGIKGTEDVAGVVDEIELNSRKIKSLTGHKPKFYRSGTAYYDEVAVEIASYLGYQVVGFCILGDAGATYSQKEIEEALIKNATPGAVILCHMNHPEGETAEGLMAAIPCLRKAGFKFIKLRDCKLK